MIRGLEKLPNDDWLKHLGLFSLQKRQVRGDMAEVHKLHYNMGFFLGGGGKRRRTIERFPDMQ